MLLPRAPAGITAAAVCSDVLELDKKISTGIQYCLEISWSMSVIYDTRSKGGPVNPQLRKNVAYKGAKVVQWIVNIRPEEDEIGL